MIDLAIYLICGLSVLVVIAATSESRYWRRRYEAERNNAEHYFALYVAERELHEAEFSRN